MSLPLMKREGREDAKNYDRPIATGFEYLIQAKKESSDGRKIARV